MVALMMKRIINAYWEFMKRTGEIRYDSYKRNPYKHYY
jgi:hypothetical protein